MICNNCGNQINENAHTCPYCGAAVYQSETVYNNAHIYALSEEEDSKKQSNVLILGILATVFNNSIYGIIMGTIALYLSKQYTELTGKMPASVRTGKILGIVSLVLGIVNVVTAVVLVTLWIFLYIFAFGGTMVLSQL